VASGRVFRSVPRDKLFEQIGRLKVELDWVKKKAAAFL
jgi:hypothetical protein